ncbi:MAG: hypothetical protein A2Y84_01335 [Candidatus Colwellbacteria bacterium RBG_13_48_8]|uniref:Dockerin domain-containing protein n=1 Tax=Candidatus Colwellbacteria bacterium RBG_13_48_8 TaxID=1797685 RepID=A0A1G1YXZ6_9BACT|nr:MAG: hypothetical protein A2Y84_01335 [Candidatus Colwellbacteria bacterium RBG_13_48_8]
MSKELNKVILLALLLLCLLPLPAGAQENEDIGVSVTIPSGEEDGGGGGGGGITYTNLTVEGYAYPKAMVTALRNGAAFASVRADEDGTFIINVLVHSGSATIGVWARDSLGLISQPSEIAVYLPGGSSLEVSDVFLSPTIKADKSVVFPGSPVKILGSAYPGSVVKAFTNLPHLNLIEIATANLSGHWEYSINTIGLAHNIYLIKVSSHSYLLNLTSPLSRGVRLNVGPTLSIPFEGITCSGVDFNFDGRVDVIDFSIMLFYWEANPLEVDPPNICVDQDGNSLVNIYDFSRLMYGWKE